MNNALKELISRFCEEPENLELISRIRNLQASEADFNEELLESFPAEMRRKIYLELVLWTDRANLRKILERRANSETDLLCNRRLRLMISGLKESPPE